MILTLFNVTPWPKRDFTGAVHYFFMIDKLLAGVYHIGTHKVQSKREEATEKWQKQQWHTQGLRRK